MTRRVQAVREAAARDRATLVDALRECGSARCSGGGARR